MYLLALKLLFCSYANVCEFNPFINWVKHINTSIKISFLEFHLFKEALWVGFFFTHALECCKLQEGLLLEGLVPVGPHIRP